MKLLDVRWPAVLAELPRWDALPVAARRVALDQLKPSANVAAAALGPARDALLGAGLVRLDPAGRRALVADDARELVRVLRAADRHRVFDAPTPAALLHYLEEHFTTEDVQRLGGWAGPSGGWVGGYGSRPALAARVGFEGWAGDLLAADADAALGAWATARGAALTDPPDESLHVLRALQRLVRRLLDAPDGLPLREAAADPAVRGGDDRGDDDRGMFADALHAGLRFAVVLLGMRGDDLEPLVGVWPSAARELRRPAAAAPAPVVPDETFDLAVRMEDMTTVLAAAAAEPVRLRANDLAVFARARKAIDARLVALPEWAAPLLPVDPERRVAVAVTELRQRGLARVRGTGSGEPHLEATAAGTRWLAGTPHARLDALLAPLRCSAERNPPSYASAYGGEGAARFFPYVLPFYQVPNGLDLPGALADAFRTTDGSFVPLGEFLDHQARAANPLLALHAAGGADGGAFGRAQMTYYTGPHADPRQMLRALWRQMLEQFLVDRLAAFGGVRLGRAADGALCVALADPGRYLFGTAATFAYGADEAGAVVVQPNFDVVFLAPNPAVEAELARFAERVGHAPGVAFRLTRASVLAAAEAGLGRDELLGVLARASSRPLPANVAREVEGWLAGVRRARVRVATLLECPDAETAARVLAALGAKAQRLTPTLFELAAGAPAEEAGLLRRLRAAGVFLDGHPRAGVRTAARRGRRARRGPQDNDAFA
ncbi:hypothetical protein tb265_16620 [Gemmatimonadetes bacterium T265]|nr:hypothetical protein tb265_16620 [Gemmatimonadetes bacterium T265]